MHDNRSHPLLQQVPLTVSPFVNLPTSVTLPYTYKTMPSALPPSVINISVSAADDGTAGASKPRYVVSQSGHAAHPDDIIASCRALQSHVAKLQADADAELRALDERIRARELAEKRRVAPGWLDSDARLLEPERSGTASPPAGHSGLGLPGAAPSGDGRGLGAAGSSGGGVGPAAGVSEMAAPDPGEELDRAFGALAFRPK
ncbi:hypothetical protein NKR23_g6958 [Pleurostoma richardsiae]|uniref:Uncharacterized protein n=1 Tax=Pleurostoma richardsiae TaxID=41990 RepID=A0AA38R9A2_9PEZI|nr:hypothetical protein NKR23_g6958 [Pleurostoma richardsiae]